MLTETQEKFLRVMPKIARECVLRDFRDDSCIASTKVAIALCKVYKLEAIPVACRVMVCNAQFEACVNREARMPDSAEENKIWQVQHGAYSVGIGFGGLRGLKTPNVAGHLVAYLTEGIVIDAAIDQASRPAFDICLEPAAFRVLPERFLLGKERSLCYVGSNLCAYETYPDDIGYRQSNDWRIPSRTERVIQAALCEVKAAMKTSRSF